MSKQYKIVVNNGPKAAAQEIEVLSGQGQPVRIPAKAGVRYVLQDTSKQPVAAPDTVRASRKGKNLHLSLGESNVDDIIIEDYYSTFAANENAVTGLAEDGLVYEYIPQDPSAQNLLPQLADGSEAVDLVLGGEGVQAGAAVAAVAPLIGPGTLAAAGAGAAAAAAGGGGGGATDNTAQQALQDIGTFAEANTTGLVNASGTAPDFAKYTAAGVTGLGTSAAPNTTLIAAVNDALASAAVNGAAVDTVAKVQAIVDSYSRILAESDGNATDNTTGTAVPTSADYANIGVTGTTTDSAKLLSDVIDNKQAADVDTVAEIQALADAAQAVVNYSGSNTAPSASVLNAIAGGTTPATTVNADNLAAVQAAVAAANNDGTPVTQAELQSIISAINTAAADIGAFAQANTTGLANATGTAPNLEKYTAAGVTGLGNSAAPNTALIAAVNDALASAAVNGAAADTPAEIQAIVDSYAQILVAADGDASDNTTGTAVPDSADYARIGVTGTTADSAKLLSDVIDNKAPADVNTVAEIQVLADAAQAVVAYTGANGQTAPTAAQIQALAGGALIVTPQNLATVQAAIAAANTNTSGTGANAPITQAELQAIVAALDITAPTQPTVALGSGANDGVTLAEALAGPVTVRAESGSTVVVTFTDGAGHTVSKTVTGNGQTPVLVTLTNADLGTGANQLADGNITVSAVATDAAGNPSDAGVGSFALATQGPLLSLTTLAANTVSDSSPVAEFNAAEYQALNTTPLSLQGTTSANNRTVYAFLNGRTYQVTASNSSWEIDLPTSDATDLNHGSTYTTAVQVSDSAGNTTSFNNYALRINTAAPDIPTVQTQWTNDSTPTLSGVARKLKPGATSGSTNLADYMALEAGDTISLSVGDNTVNATVGSLPAGFSYNGNSGAWSFDAQSAGWSTLADNTYNVSISTQAGGIVKTDVSANELHINTAAPTVTLDALAGDGIINVAESTTALQVHGTTDAAAGSPVSISVGGQTYTTQVLYASTGNFIDFNIPAAAVQNLAATQGTKPITINVTNEYGTPQQLSPSLSVDTLAPATPAQAPTGYGDDVGALQSTNSTAASTDDTTPGINVGAGLTTNTPSLYVNGVKVDATYNSATGALTPVAPLSEGAKAFTYTLTDASGNESGQSPALNVNINTASPTIGSASASWGAVLNAAESTTDQTISVTTTGIEDGQTVTVSLSGHTYTAQVSSGSATVTVPAADLAALSDDQTYNYTVSVSNSAGTPAVANNTSFSVHKTPPLTPVMSAISVTADDVINNAEASTGNNVTVTGSVTNAAPTDSVTVTVGGNTYTGTIAANGTFSVSVPGSALATAATNNAASLSVSVLAPTPTATPPKAQPAKATTSTPACPRPPRVSASKTPTATANPPSPAPPSPAAPSPSQHPTAAPTPPRPTPPPAPSAWSCPAPPTR